MSAVLAKLSFWSNLLSFRVWSLACVVHIGSESLIKKNVNASCSVIVSQLETSNTDVTHQLGIIIYDHEPIKESIFTTGQR